MSTKVVHTGKKTTELRHHKEANPLVSFQSDMNRLFDDFFDETALMSPWGYPSMSFRSPGFTPSVDIADTDKEVTVTAEIPGMDNKDIKLELDDSALTIRGEKKEDHEEKGRNWYRMERSYGSFSRVIPLPARVDAHKAKAEFRKGVLTVALPKLHAEHEKHKLIKVHVEG